MKITTAVLSKKNVKMNVDKTKKKKLQQLV